MPRKGPRRTQEQPQYGKALRMLLSQGCAFELSSNDYPADSERFYDVRIATHSYNPKDKDKAKHYPTHTAVFKFDVVLATDGRIVEILPRAKTTKVAQCITNIPSLFQAQIKKAIRSRQGMQHEPRPYFAHPDEDRLQPHNVTGDCA